jgi:integrase
MSAAYHELIAAVESCLRVVPGIKSKMPIKGTSATTAADYMNLAARMIGRSDSTGAGLAQVVQDTSHSNTFYKRVAALRHHCLTQFREKSDRLPEALNEASWTELASSFRRLLRQMEALVELQDIGMTQPRQRRKSKRQALPGLPPDWRIDLFNRGSRGKYAQALLVSALTGARPHELVMGADAWVAHDETLDKAVVCIHLPGAKVKANQGQPNRYVSFALDDDDPLVAALVHRVFASPDGRLQIRIAHGGNFTKETQRLARDLWPKHPHAITAYCFRHQWSADVKAQGDAGAVSRGLGHRSAKTRRHYGTANQANGAHCLRPIRIEADLPITGLRPRELPATAEQSTPRP